MFKKLTLPLLLTLFITSSGNAQGTFVVKDVLAADPNASIIDPEYNIALNSVCWQSNDDDLWVCSLDPVSHFFMPPDGKGYLVDHDLTHPGPGGWNGPEWLLSNGSTQIIYNQKKGGVRYPGLATRIIGGWNSSTLMQYPGALYSMATRSYSDSVGIFLFESVDNDGIHWVKTNDLNTCYLYPDVTLGFFANDNQQICCALNHSRQPGYVEVATTLPFFTQISDDTIGAPSMWNDPQTNRRMFMYRTNGSQTLKIFQENEDGIWNPYYSFNSPLPEPFIYITSPEPFTFGGRSYVSFMASESTMGMDEPRSQIWIASIDPLNPLMRRVSDSTDMVRMDPEPVVFADSAFIYYTQKIFTRWFHFNYLVRKCDTGLEESFYTGQNDDVASEKGISIYPNPSSGVFSIQSALLTSPGQKWLTIYSTAGKEMARMKLSDNPSQVKLEHLAGGVYHLKLESKEGTVDGKLVINR